MKNLISSTIFQTLSDVKIKLMMEEIKMHYIFLQYDVGFFDDLISYILEIKNLFTQKIEANTIYKRKPVKFNIILKINIKKVILLMSEALQAFPFEYMPFFQTNRQHFYRIPSFTYLSQNIFHKKKYVLDNLFYVLNPQGDLINTQNHFQQFLSKFL